MTVRVAFGWYAMHFGVILKYGVPGEEKDIIGGLTVRSVYQLGQGGWKSAGVGMKKKGELQCTKVNSLTDDGSRRMELKRMQCTLASDRGGM